MLLFSVDNISLKTGQKLALTHVIDTHSSLGKAITKQSHYRSAMSLWLGVQVRGLLHAHLSPSDNPQMAALMRYIRGSIRKSGPQ